MIFYKIYYHLSAILKCLFLKLVYGKKLSVGKKTTWRKNFNVMISANGSINIGENCFFNNDCSINSLSRIVIGNGSIFGENVKIYDHNHRFNVFDVPIKEQGYSVGDIIIGNHCWIGSNVVILKGSIIGDNCVIGAGVIVSGIVEANTVVKQDLEYSKEMIRVEVYE